MSYTKEYRRSTKWLCIVGGLVFLVGIAGIIYYTLCDKPLWFLFIAIADIAIGLLNFGVWYFLYYREREYYKEDEP